jgi:DNA repair exonuclease SbcCD ATPase subunit
LSNTQSGIIFEKIRWKNFLATGNSFIEVDLAESPTTLVLGENGAGKSTMLDALCFALFGKAFRNINKPQLTNSINEKDCMVECEFTIGNTNYMIRRGQKPGIFEIYQNGTLFNQDSTARDYQKYLEQSILKLNYKSFTQIVVLGASNFTPFMQLSAMDRRAVIEDLLDIQVFSNMNVVLKQKIKDSESELAYCDSQIHIIKEKIELQQDHIRKIREKDQQSIKKLEEEIENAKQQIGERWEAISSLDEKIKKLTQTAFTKEGSISLYDRSVQMKRKVQAKMGKIKDSIEFYEHNSTCPTCSQDIDDDFKQKSISEQKDRMGKLDEALDQVEVLIGEQKSIMQEHQKIMGEIRSFNDQRSDLQSEIRGFETYMAKVSAKIQDQTNSNSDTTDSESKLESFKDDKQKSESKRKNVIEEQHYLKIAETILKDTGIKSKIIRQYLPIMNKFINQYLQKMDFFVNFNLDENFKETVKSRHRDEFSYNSFSEGQKFRINIAILLAWREIARLKNSTNTNLLVLDEVFDSSLDSAGVDDFMELLQLVSNDRTNVFVISHRGQTMIDKFDRVIEFYMRKDFTKMQKKDST